MHNIISKISDKEILFVQMEPPQAEEGGDYYYRTYAPSYSLAQEKSIYTVSLSSISRKREELTRQADILILKNICDADILPVIAERKKTNKISIYEIADDLGAIPAWNPVYFFYQNKENISLFKRTAASCDAIQFTVSELQRKYDYLNAHTAVFPNQVSIIPPRRKYIHKKDMVIGWGGSHGHCEDIREIAPALTGWLKEHSTVKLYLMCSRDIWDLFRQVPERQKKLYTTGSIEEYYTFLQNIDIGLAPLNDTAFNRSRSDVKFLEYAISEVVPVVQDLTPYRENVQDGINGILFSNPARLISTLDFLYNDQYARNNIAGQARTYVLQNRLQKDHNAERLDFYLSLLHHTVPQEERINSIFDALEKETGTFRLKRYLHLSPTAFEQSLYNGLIYNQIDQNKFQACLMFEQAMSLQPQNYLPHLFGASVMPDTIQSLQKAISLNPLSIKSLILIGEEYLARKDFINALKYFEMAADLFPSYEIPYMRAAQTLKCAGMNAQAEELLIKAQSLMVN
jgi:tetratricopeptide (TPR) repeat protein